jgi:hypothetical protein
MNKKSFVIAALVLVGSAAVLFFGCRPNEGGGSSRGQFVQRRGSRFEIDGRPFRFVGANVAVMYRDEDREHMAETLTQAAAAGC